MHMLLNDQGKRVALYCRVSSEDQAERGTIGAQRTLLQDLAAAYRWDIAGLYEDDGVSGTIPFSQRPAGRKLLEEGVQVGSPKWCSSASTGSRVL